MDENPYQSPNAPDEPARSRWLARIEITAGLAIGLVGVLTFLIIAGLLAFTTRGKGGVRYFNVPPSTRHVVP